MLLQGKHQKNLVASLFPSGEWKAIAEWDLDLSLFAQVSAGWRQRRVTHWVTDREDCSGFCAQKAYLRWTFKVANNLLKTKKGYSRRLSSALLSLLAKIVLKKRCRVAERHCAHPVYAAPQANGEFVITLPLSKQGAGEPLRLQLDIHSVPAVPISHAGLCYAHTYFCHSLAWFSHNASIDDQSVQLRLHAHPKHPVTRYCYSQHHAECRHAATVV